MYLTRFVELMKKDIPNDRKSLFWDGTDMTVIEDELDDDGVMDGRGGEYMVSRQKTQIGCIFSVDCENLLSEENNVRNDENCFAVESRNRFLQVFCPKQKYSQMKEYFKTDIEGRKIAEYALKLDVECLCAKTILTAPSGRLMAGIQVITLDKEDKAIVYQYGGIGNFGQIQVEGDMFIELTADEQ